MIVQESPKFATVMRFGFDVSGGPSHSIMAMTAVVPILLKEFLGAAKQRAK